MRKPKHYYCELYRMNFYFYVGWPEQEFYKSIKKIFGFEPKPASRGGYTLFCEKDGARIIAVWAKKGDKAALTHECVHAANFTLSQVGVHASFDNDEPQAYLVGHLFEKAVA